VDKFGVDSFCSLLSESGRFYQNAERILNAAEYFVQRHHGRIPNDITIPELCSLHGVGYKTANIVLTTCFKRMDGIPSDIHVMRWCSLLGWNSLLTGLECSKSIEQWLPKNRWGSINPLFGCFGQLLTAKKTRLKMLEIVHTCAHGELRNTFLKAKDAYTQRRKTEHSSNK
jgi:endonuclease-3